MKLRKALGLALAAALLLYAGYLCLLYFAQSSMLYPGAANRVDPRPPDSQGVEVLRISSAAGHTEALFLPATTDSPGTKQPVVVFGHGNGELTDYWLTALSGFRERGIGVLLVEYPGYGRSAGSPSEGSIRMARGAAYDRIASDARVDRTRIFGFGQSLGGGAICLLANDRYLRALILQSTFPTLDIFASRYWAPSFVLHDHFNNIATVARFAGPVLVIHGRHDRLIPWDEGQRLAAASAHSIFGLYDCGHGCWDPDRVPFWHDVLPFLEQAGIALQNPGRP
jgi:uncharacterized protein